MASVAPSVSGTTIVNIHVASTNKLKIKTAVQAANLWVRKSAIFLGKTITNTSDDTPFAEKIQITLPYPNTQKMTTQRAMERINQLVQLMFNPEEDKGEKTWHLYVAIESGIKQVEEEIKPRSFVRRASDTFLQPKVFRRRASETFNPPKSDPHWVECFTAAVRLIGPNKDFSYSADEIGSDIPLKALMQSEASGWKIPWEDFDFVEASCNDKGIADKVLTPKLISAITLALCQISPLIEEEEILDESSHHIESKTS